MAANTAERRLREVFNPQSIGHPEKLFARLNWESEEFVTRLRGSDGIVTDEIVRFVSTGLFLFSPPGLRVMLPHVLCYAARHPESDVSESVIHRLYGLCDAEEDDVLLAFSPYELVAIADFLGWLSDTEADGLIKQRIGLTRFYLTALAQKTSG